MCLCFPFLAPKQAPSFLKAWNTSSTSLTASWQAVDDTSVAGYKVTFVKNKTVGSILTCNTTTIELQRLDKYSWYQIIVQAYNIEGFGVNNSVYCRTAEDGKYIIKK